MERYCTDLMEMLWDTDKADNLISRAVAIVDKAAAGGFDRDKIRADPFTKRVIEECKGATANNVPAATV
jgi:hypothetical protein